MCPVHTDGVLLRSEHPPPYYILSSIVQKVCTGCALLNALTGIQIKQAALHRRLTAVLKDKTVAPLRALDQFTESQLPGFEMVSRQFINLLLKFAMFCTLNYLKSGKVCVLPLHPV